MDEGIPIVATSIGASRVDASVLPAGKEILVNLLPGQRFVLIIISGRVIVSRTDRSRRQIEGHLLSPVILDTPGVYRIFARTLTFAVRMEREASE